MSSTGVLIGDASRNSIQRPRIQIDAALTALGAVLEETQPGDLCPTDDVRESIDERSYPVVNGRTEYGVICADDSDWFVFPGGQGSEINLQLDFDHASGDLDLELWDADEVLLTSDSETDGESITGTVNVAQTYYVRVYGFQGAENDYELTVRYTSCPPDDQFEDNDTLAGAASLQPGTTVFGEACSGDPDVYRLDLTAGTPVAAQIDFLHRFGDVDAYLYDASGSLLAQSFSVTDNEYVNYTAPTTGAYYLWIQGFDGAENSYRLAVRDGSLCPRNDPYEPNDDQIRTIEPGAGQVVSAVACPDESDWFGIELQPGMTLDVDLEFSHASGDLDM
ncbi:MAG: PPC domain-containing protein, partial [Halobacteriales archaeon]|nr:PPC domain-containing protein [Halobacteriales archaeon]